MSRLFLIRHIRNSIFNKILLLYSALIVCTVSVLIGIIIVSLSDLLRDQAVDYTGQVVKTAGHYFHAQCVNFKNNQKNLYNPAYLPGTVSNDMFSLLGNGGSTVSPDYAEKYNLVNSFFSATVMPSDIDIRDVVLMSRDFSWNMLLSRNSSAENGYYRLSQIEKTLKKQDTASISDKKIRIIPAFFSGTGNERTRSYAIYDYVRNTGGTGYAGYMAYSFDVGSVAQSYAQFDPYLLGSILIVTPGGDVVFDSSDRYYGQTIPFHREMVNQDSGSFTWNGSIVNFAQDNTFDFITVGIIPRNAIYKRVNILNGKIILAAAACIMCVIFFTSLITRLFSKRVRTVVSTIKQIQRGNFSARTKVGGGEDEIQLIAHNLNIMSEKIDDYIKREYVYELRQKDALLKQKTAQLYALQLQINPHFLYNTLETIRMTALSAGDGDVEKMVKILARMLRGSIKGAPFVTVREELQNCESYLELIKIRFGERLKISYQIDAEIMPYAIPKNLMQPIIENSIVHGGKTNTIAIRGFYKDEKIVITVTDNGEGIPEDVLRDISTQLNASYDFKDGKIGIFNVNSRIKLIYGNEYGLKIRSRIGEGTKVTVTIKAMEKEALS